MLKPLRRYFVASRQRYTVTAQFVGFVYNSVNTVFLKSLQKKQKAIKFAPKCPYINIIRANK